MNETQVLFTLFFAISWGTMANVLPRWRAFNYGLWSREFPGPLYRALVAFVIFNLLPWALFGLALFWLRGVPVSSEKWTLSSVFLMVVRGVLPGIVPFGCYRLWLGLIQYFPDRFYAQNQEEVPEKFRSSRPDHPHEPTIADLDLKQEGAPKNLIFALIYFLFILFTLIPQG